MSSYVWNHRDCVLSRLVLYAHFVHRVLQSVSCDLARSFLPSDSILCSPDNAYFESLMI